MTQDELKAMVGQAALDHVVPGEIVGVGTGSTVNHFIDALGQVKERIVGAVSSSVASTQRLQALGIKVFDCNEVGEIAVYIDGADFDKAKAHGAQSVDAAGVFVQTCGHTDAVGKGQAGQFNRVVDSLVAPSPLQR